MKRLDEAIELYKKGLYEEALFAFESVSQENNLEWADVYVRLCKSKLHKDGGVVKTESCKFNELNALDVATKIMLCNANKISLTNAEKLHLINEFKEITQKKSPQAKITHDIAAIKKGKYIPTDMNLKKLPESSNDFLWAEQRRSSESYCTDNVGLSIIIPVYNRPKILGITLACICNQITNYKFEVVISDDGSYDDLLKVVKKFEDKIDIRYYRHSDNGYRVASARNAGVSLAKYDYIGFLDCDMAPDENWVQSYMDLLIQHDNVALIGPRKYICTQKYNYIDFLSNKKLIKLLPEVKTNNSEANSIAGDISVDWRLEHFKKTENLRFCDSPFRFFAAGNIALSKKWFNHAGGFDESFTFWGGEDVEFGYRLYRYGVFFRYVERALAYHQEPENGINETSRSEGHKRTRPMLYDKVPYPYRRNMVPVENSVISSTPLVSIYIPAYNCAATIRRAIESALNQSVTDLEVCICDDGSDYDTKLILHKYYKQHPRVRFVSQENKGIGAASNAALNICRGFYIGQLDADDYLEPDAVETCLAEFKKQPNLVCCYTTYRNVDENGMHLSDGYNWPVYIREKLMTTMICHHFRMFTIRAWHLTEGFNEKILNAVDYDFFLKLSEVGMFKHINKVCYNRVLHGENTSIKNAEEQKINHAHVVNLSLRRHGIKSYKYIYTPGETVSQPFKRVGNISVD
ncbi:TPA: glycosyltransferase [Escherichia coli]